MFLSRSTLLSSMNDCASVQGQKHLLEILSAPLDRLLGCLGMSRKTGYYLLARLTAEGSYNGNENRNWRDEFMSESSTAFLSLSPKASAYRANVIYRSVAALIRYSHVSRAAGIC